MHFPFSLGSTENITEHITHLRMFSVMMISWLFSNARELFLRRRICLLGFQREKMCMENEAPHFNSAENSQCFLNVSPLIWNMWDEEHARPLAVGISHLPPVFFSIVTQNLTEPFTRAGVWSLSHAETDLVILRNVEEDLILSASDLFFVHESFWGLD